MFLKRIRRFLRQNYGYGPLIGLLLAIGGVSAGYNGYPYWSTFLIGVGTPVIAAGLVTLLSPSADEIYQQFLALGIRGLWPSRRDVPPRNWCEWLGQTSKQCTLLGVAHGEWRNDEKFGPALINCLRRKDVEVKILFLNPIVALLRRERVKNKEIHPPPSENLLDSFGVSEMGWRSI